MARCAHNSEVNPKKKKYTQHGNNKEMRQKNKFRVCASRQKKTFTNCIIWVLKFLHFNVDLLISMSDCKLVILWAQNAHYAWLCRCNLILNDSLVNFFMGNLISFSNLNESKNFSLYTLTLLSKMFFFIIRAKIEYKRQKKEERKNGICNFCIWQE